MRVAERLFAERGVDSVTLLEIAQAAEQRNRAAVQYHFKDRRGLVEACLNRHSKVVQESWIEPLAMLRRENMLTVERCVGLMVSSVVRRAHHEDGGAAYISMCRQLLVHPTIRLMDTDQVKAEGARAMGQAIAESVAVPKGFTRLYTLRLAHLLFHSVGDYLEFGRSKVSREAFEVDLVRSICGWLHSTEEGAAQAAT